MIPKPNWNLLRAALIGSMAGGAFLAWQAHLALLEFPADLRSRYPPLGFFLKFYVNPALAGALAGAAAGGLVWASLRCAGLEPDQPSLNVRGGFWGAGLGAVLGAVLPALCFLLDLLTHPSPYYRCDRLFVQPLLYVSTAVVGACVGWSASATTSTHGFLRSFTVECVIVVVFWFVIGCSTEVERAHNNLILNLPILTMLTGPPYLAAALVTLIRIVREPPAEYFALKLFHATAPTQSKPPQLDLKSFIDSVGSKKMVDAMGVASVVDAVTLKRIIETVGIPRMMDEIGRERLLAELLNDMTQADRDQLKQILEDAAQDPSRPNS